METGQTPAVADWKTVDDWTPVDVSAPPVAADVLARARAEIARQQNQPQPGALARFGKSLASTVLPSDTPSDYIQGPLYAAQHPIESAKLLGGAMLNAQGQQFSKAKQALNQGDYVQAAGYGLAGATPLLGPGAAHAGEQFGSGDIAGGLGTTTGLLGQALIPEAVRQGVPAVARGRAARAVAASEAAKLDLTDVLKPPKADFRFEADFQKALPDIVAAAGGKEKITSAKALASAAKKAAADRGAELQAKFIDPLRDNPNAQVALDKPVTDMAEQLMSNRERIKYPELAKLVKGDPVGVGEAHQALKDINNIQEALASKSEGRQRIMAADPEWGWLVDVGRNLRKNLYETLDHGAADLNQLQGALGHIRDLAVQAEVTARRTPVKGTSVFDPRFEARAEAQLPKFKLMRKVQEGLGAAHPDARIARSMQKLQVGLPPEFTVGSSRIGAPSAGNKAAMAKLQTLLDQGVPLREALKQVTSGGNIE